MKLRIEFDNESDGELVELDTIDLAIDVGTDRLEPTEVLEGRIALYEAPDDLDLSLLDEALEDFAWSYNGYSIVDASPEPGGF